jgi:hypothetical protein
MICVCAFRSAGKGDYPAQRHLPGYRKAGA